MTVHIPVSFGELIDKLTILKIKAEKITDIKKIKFIDIEFYSLNQVYLKYYKMMDKDVIVNIKSLYNDLYNINNELWIIEDNIRDKERNKELLEKVSKDSGYFRLKSHGVGKYGRVLGEIFIQDTDGNSININEQLKLEGHAYEYHGGKKQIFKG